MAPSSEAGAPNHHLLSVLVENRPGVLTRVAGLFARRGYNIHSLAVAPTDDGSVSRISMVVDLGDTPLPQLIQQVDKLINVLDITALAPSEAVEREMLLATVSTGPDGAAQVASVLEGFDARVLDATGSSTTVVVLGTPDEVDEAERNLTSFGLVAAQRSGRVALPALGAPN